MKRSAIRGLSQRFDPRVSPGFRCAPSGLRRKRWAVWQL